MMRARLYIACIFFVAGFGSVFSSCSNSEDMASITDTSAKLDDEPTINSVDTAADTIQPSITSSSAKLDDEPTIDSVDTTAKVIPDSRSPKLFIQCENPNSSDFTPASFLFFDAVEHYSYFAPTPDRTESGYIRIRGNSTAGAPKKPYNIKFNEKIDFFGMGKAKKWVLLSNPFDPTLIRNKLIFDLASKLSFVYSPKSYFLDVWLNGEYVGNYQFAEKVEFNKNRIPYDVDKGDFLFEYVESRKKKDVVYVISPLNSFRFAMAEPQSPTATQLKSLQTEFHNIETAISTKDIREYMKFVDLCSMIDHYWIEEFVNDPDMHTGSRYFSIHNGILRAGPVWDYDLSMGNTKSSSRSSTTGIHARAIWWKDLFQDSVFEKIACERFLQIEPLFENLVSDNNLGKNMLDSILDFFGESFQRNYSDSGWTYCGSPAGAGNSGKTLTCPYSPIPQPTYDENILFLKDWIIQRHAYLKKTARKKLTELDYIKIDLESILASQDSIFAQK